MLTADEVAAITIFEGLSGDACERLARLAADVRLAPGEYAVHAQERRVLFAVLEGRLETVNMVDGILRVVGGRGPGELVGEVPIALGTTFPFGFRAVEPTRLMRLEAEDYHATVAQSPEVGERLGALARERIGRLQGITAETPPPRAIVVGQRWDPATNQLRRFLDRNQVTFRWITPDAADGEAVWGGPLPAEEDCPVIRLVNGKTVVQPDLRRVAQLLQLATEAEVAEYDTVIVGGGPAGLAAAVYGASEGLRTIVIEREAPGGQAGTSLADRELPRLPVRRVRRRAGQPRASAGAPAGRRDPGDPADHPHRRWRRRQVHLDGGDVVRARTIILATGVSWRRLAIDGFDRLVGKGIYYGACAQRGVERARDSTCTSSAPATRPDRRRCSSPTTRAA